jgi:polysaccharide deacetylase family protein (PEP-CTERM system associated)
MSLIQTIPIPARVTNALTVDVEDYFQVSGFESVIPRSRWEHYPRRVARNTHRLLDIFGQYGVRATFFVLGWVADREPSLVREIAAAGHELASHGYRHRLVYSQSPDEFREDIRRSKACIEAIAGCAVTGYRAPSFSVTARSLWALDILMEEGFRWDSSIFPLHHDRYGIPSAPRRPFWIPYGTAERGDIASWPRHSDHAGAALDGAILEVPASTLRIAGVNLPVGGGGYFRLLPYRWTWYGINRLNRVEGTPVVFYLHPWEIDTGQPVQPAAWFSRFRHYTNLHRTEPRLRRLLGDFSFGPVSESVSCAGPGPAVVVAS